MNHYWAAAPLYVGENVGRLRWLRDKWEAHLEAYMDTWRPVYRVWGFSERTQTWSDADVLAAPQWTRSVLVEVSPGRYLADVFEMLTEVLVDCADGPRPPVCLGRSMRIDPTCDRDRRGYTDGGQYQQVLLRPRALIVADHREGERWLLEQGKVAADLQETYPGLRVNNELLAKKRREEEESAEESE